MDKQEAIKILKEFHDTSSLFSVRTALETVFPELKEDEDELEWLKQFIQEEAYTLSMDIRDDEDSFRLKKLQKSLEWLEKQGERIKLLSNKKGENVQDLIEKYVSDHAANRWLDASELEKLLNNFVLEYDGCLEKQGEPIDDNIITHDNEILQAISIGLTDAVENFGWSDFGGLPIEEIQEWLEKRGEQKPITEMKSPEESLGISSKEYNGIVNDCLYGESKSTEQTEPKFHEGDWVVDSLVGRVKQVQSIDNYGYNFNNGDFTSFDSANENYHLWTIQDAKPGDVLVDDYGNVLIYQEPLTDCYYHSYCYCNEIVFIGQGGSHGIEHSHPATQRQRELLFQKMDEAHYEWDADKKELKKIDNISNACEAVESENEMAKAALFFIENCKDYFAYNGVAKIDVINWFKETFYGK